MCCVCDCGFARVCTSRPPIYSYSFWIVTLTLTLLPSHFCSLLVAPCAVLYCTVLYYTIFVHLHVPYQCSTLSGMTTYIGSAILVGNDLARFQSKLSSIEQISTDSTSQNDALLRLLLPILFGLRDIGMPTAISDIVLCMHAWSL